MFKHLIVKCGEVIRRAVRRAAPRALYHAGAQLWNGYHGVRHMGWKPFLAFRALFSDRHPALKTTVSVRLPGLRHPVFVRPGTTDPAELLHSCIRKAYGQHIPSGEVRLIIDAGANIGDTTVFYLNRFLGASVIAVEPDHENFEILIKNCSPYGTRVRCINGGVWSCDGGLRVLGSEFASGVSVVPVEDQDAADCAAFSLSTLLSMTDAPMIDILKCDIEGAERAVFSENYEGWLSRTRHIAIEIHSRECEAAVFSAIRKYGFISTRYRDLYIFSRPDSKWL